MADFKQGGAGHGSFFDTNRKEVKSFLSTRKIAKLTFCDWSWLAEGVGGVFITAQALRGINAVGWLLPDAPLHLVMFAGVIMVIVCLFRLFNFLEEEVNVAMQWLVIGLLVLVAGGNADRIADITSNVAANFQYNANVAQPSVGNDGKIRGIDPNASDWINPVTNMALTDQQIAECKTRALAGIDQKWAKNCGYLKGGV